DRREVLVGYAGVAEVALGVALDTGAAPPDAKLPQVLQVAVNVPLVVHRANEGIAELAGEPAPLDGQAAGANQLVAEELSLRRHFAHDDVEVKVILLREECEYLGDLDPVDLRLERHALPLAATLGHLLRFGSRRRPVDRAQRGDGPHLRDVFARVLA